jgi:hypothetical protein
MLAQAPGSLISPKILLDCVVRVLAENRLPVDIWAVLIFRTRHFVYDTMTNFAKSGNVS